MPETNPLVIQRLDQINESLTALRDAYDKERDERFAQDKIVNAQLANHDALIRKMLDEREAEKAKSVGKIAVISNTISGVIGGFMLWLAERIFSYNHTIH
jgi:hypothetical protein